MILSLKREVKLLRNENHYLRERLKFPKGEIAAIKYSANIDNDDGEKTPVPMEQEKKNVNRQSPDR